MNDVFVRAVNVVCALGADATATFAALDAGDTGAFRFDEDVLPGRVVPISPVRGHLPDVADAGLPTRSSAMLRAALAPVRERILGELDRHDPRRVGVVIGTTTAGIADGEDALRARRTGGRWPERYHYEAQEMAGPARFVARELGVRGPSWVVSTACSSGARALVSAARLLRAGVLDVVVCGGVDTLSGFTVAGFDALGALAPARCNPMSRHRAGLHLGEGAALFLLGRDAAAVRLAGWGETSDAHHASAPEPSGRFAADAVRAALARAGVRAGDLDYANLHGTGTPQNDAMESRAMVEVVGSEVPCSSTKPLTGHVLGGGSAVEAALTWGVVAGAVRRLPVHLWDGEVDPALPRLRLVGADEVPARPPRVALSNAFGFGGSNVALVWRSA